MLSLLASLVALGSTAFFAAGEPAKDLVTAAASSTRPAECVARGQAGRSPSIWERARSPQRDRFCAAIAEAHARLGTDLDGAAAALARAEAAWPGRAAARVVDARLKLAKGDPKAALASFDDALHIDSRAVADPATLRDHARALARGGRGAEALTAYRALAPQATLLPLPARAEALVEASLASMAATEPAAKEILAIRAGEALALVREARALGATPIAAETALVYALALDRAGDAPGSQRELAEAARLGTSLQRLAPLVVDAADAIALEALALEPTDRAKAAAAWDRYVAAPGSATWRGAAERRRDALRAGATTQAKGASSRRNPDAGPGKPGGSGKKKKAQP